MYLILQGTDVSVTCYNDFSGDLLTHLYASCLSLSSSGDSLSLVVFFTFFRTIKSLSVKPAGLMGSGLTSSVLALACKALE